MSTTLDQFHDEFQQFVKLEAKRWEENEKRWEMNEKRWEMNEKRWEVNEKKWFGIEKTMRKMDKKIDKLFDYLDREIMTDRKRIDKIERAIKNPLAL